MGRGRRRRRRLHTSTRATLNDAASTAERRTDGGRGTKSLAGATAARNVALPAACTRECTHMAALLCMPPPQVTLRGDNEGAS